MAVYVDQAINPWRGQMWCHMYADTLDELHQFAGRLGLKREWFQDKSTLKHYDLTENKKQQAILLGAIEQKVREEIVRTWGRCEGSCQMYKDFAKELDTDG